jgi:hypothetical protein
MRHLVFIQIYPLEVIGTSSSSSTASRCRKNCRNEFRRELDELVGVDDDRPDDDDLVQRWKKC